MPVALVATAAPKPALGVSPDGGSSGASAGAAGGAAPSVYLRCRLIRPWPMAGDALVQGVVVVQLQRIPAASGVRMPATPANPLPQC